MFVGILSLGEPTMPYDPRPIGVEVELAQLVSASRRVSPVSGHERPIHSGIYLLGGSGTLRSKLTTAKLIFERPLRSRSQAA